MSELEILSPDDASRRILSPLSGQRCSVVTSSYGNELVLGFGATHRPRPPLRETPRADWMLYSRATPWVLETAEGVVATERRRLGHRALEDIQDTILGTEILEGHIRNAALGLTLQFSNAAFSLLPPALRRQQSPASAEVWELAAPDSQVLIAYADQGLVIARADEVPPIEPEESYLAAAATTAREAEPIALTNDYYLQRRRAARFQRMLENVAHDLDYDLFTSSLDQPNTQIDAVMVTPEGTLIGVQYTSTRSPLRSPARAEIKRFLLIADDGSKPSFRRRKDGTAVARVAWIGGPADEVKEALTRLAVA
jgi:hypothetical protein